MAIVQTLSPASDGHRRLGLASPATREPVGEITVSTPDEVTAAIARARAAQPGWAARPGGHRPGPVLPAHRCHRPDPRHGWGRKKENIWYPYADKTVRTLESSIKTLFGNRLARRVMR